MKIICSDDNRQSITVNSHKSDKQKTNKKRKKGKRIDLFHKNHVERRRQTKRGNRSFRNQSPNQTRSIIYKKASSDHEVSGKFEREKENWGGTPR